MQETMYSVSWAVKFLDVQSHVLRYWEEELELPIKRNEMGHRYYTREDIQVFLSIKELKKKGYSLKEIRELTSLFYRNQTTGEGRERRVREKSQKKKSKKQGSENCRKEEEKPGKVSVEFLEVISKLVENKLKEENPEEARYKRLDERIRICQQSRREVAATEERGKTKKRKSLFSTRRTKLR